MSYQIELLGNFKREFKKLAKKHRSLTDDFEKLLSELQNNPEKGEQIKGIGLLKTGKVFKTRMAISSLKKGKSGGARIITYVITEDEIVYLLSIYEKSVHDNIKSSIINELIKECLDNSNL